MKFVLAPDKFKGSLSGNEFCEVAEVAIRKLFPNAIVVKKPLADGGDGTMEVVRDYLNAKEISLAVSGPLFQKVTASYLYSERRKVAFIEMSEASGYRLLQAPELNCKNTTTLGTGELILDALNRGAKEMVLGIGGSATNDAGMGMAHALGYRFLDDTGQVLQPIGKHLSSVASIDTSKIDDRLKELRVKVACDVTNPFYGPDGAAYVYAPQKGASEEEVAFLDSGLQHFSTVLEHTFDFKVQSVPGAGAAGGLGGGAIAFLNASLDSGIAIIKEIAQFDEAIKDAHWIITGEGKLDHQTLSGKTIAGVLESAKNHQKDVAAFCGVVELTLEEQEAFGLTYCTSILRAFQTLEEAKKSSAENLEFAIFNFCKVLKKDMTLL